MQTLFLRFSRASSTRTNMTTSYTKNSKLKQLPEDLTPCLELSNKRNSQQHHTSHSISKHATNRIAHIDSSTGAEMVSPIVHWDTQVETRGFLPPEHLFTLVEPDAPSWPAICLQNLVNMVNYALVTNASVLWGNHSLQIFWMLIFVTSNVVAPRAMSRYEYQPMMKQELSFSLRHDENELHWEAVQERHGREEQGEEQQRMPAARPYFI